ncbi:MAG: proline iminopeptidase-family hydrolase [Ignavibacteria bacterium]|nr:proline iminopeptidase-family hydrolase [Ignavibacteria bacterium]
MLTLEPHEGFINVEGGKIWYKIVGAQKSKTPLVVIHGGPGATHDYLESIAELSDERPIIFYDQLGSGNSDLPADNSLWNVERFVNELDSIIKQLTTDKVHLLGQSWGTMLAVDYMLTRKNQQVTSLILSAPCLSAELWVKDQKKYLSEFEIEIQHIINEAEINKDFSSSEYQNAMMLYYRKHMCNMHVWPEMLQRTFAKMGQSVYNYMWGASEFTVTGTLKNYNRVKELKNIKIPVLFTAGRYDEASPESTRIYKDNLPGSEIYIFEDATHSHHLEKTDEYNSLIRAFLNKVN